jgi:hypothetical protein
MRKLLIICSVCFFTFTGNAQQQYSNRTIDEIITNLYSAISGPVGQPRDWPRFYSTFDSTGRMQIAITPQPGQKALRTFTPEQYATRSDKRLLEIGFEEKEIHRITETYGSVTHVFSTYESKLLLNGKQETIRGINSIQLYFDGRRYYILSVYWEGNTQDNIVPQKYLN